MERRNGRMHAATSPTAHAVSGYDDLNTKGVTVAFTHPTPRATGLAWQCEGYDDPEIFDPTDDEAFAVATTICRGCDVRTLCLTLGISRNEWGVWGGVLLENGNQIHTVRRRGRPKKVAVA